MCLLLILCSSDPLMEERTATRVIVLREWDDQNATSPEHSNQCKKRSISKPVIFYCKIVATEKQLLTPVLRFNNRQATKVVPLSRLEFVMSSLLVVLMSIFLKETTCIVPPRVLSLSLLREVGKFNQSAEGRGGEGVRGR